MESSPNTQTVSMPLEKIRQAEVEISRQIIAARKSAEQRIIDAQLQANRIKKKSLEHGDIAGQKAAEEHLAQVQSKVSEMITLAQVHHEESIQHGFKHMQTAVEYAVSFVIGLPAKEEKQ
jgi:vacuolar-type H+-ATPase subunit H